MKIGILGAGAIGLHLAAQLHKAGRDVTVICRRAEQARGIQQEGLLYEGTDQKREIIRLKAIAADQELRFECLFVTVKQPHIPSVIPQLQPWIGSGPLVCFQNGIGHEEILAEHLPQNPLFLAVTTEGAYRTGQASVRHTGQGTTWIGETSPDHRHRPLLKSVLALFAGTMLDVREEVCIKERIWKKLIINSCINPLTGILQVRNGQLAEQAETIEIMERLLSEAAEVARCEGVEIDSSFMKEIICVCRSTYDNKSSMLQDLEAGRRTEIEYINGAVERIGARHGLDAPYHSLMTKLVLAKQGT